MSRRRSSSESRTLSIEHHDRDRSSSTDKSKSKKTKEKTSFFNKDTLRGFVKRNIFRRHCEAFLETTQKSSCKTIIYDAFAGAGCYSDDLPIKEENYGSPLICLDVVIKHFKLESTPVRSEFTDSINSIEKDIQMPESENKVILNFSEADKGDCFKLVKNILSVLNTIGANFTRSSNIDGVITIQSNNFSFCINIACTEFRHVKPPTAEHRMRLLTFIDPFGYSSIPMQHVQGFIGEHKDAFINFMSSYVNRFKEVKRNEAAICKLYGFSDAEKNECLEKLRVMSDKDVDGISRCLHMYEKRLKTQDMSRYILTFTVRNTNNARYYHLIFITNHIKGFKTMKEAMNRGTQEPDSLGMSEYKVKKLSLLNDQDSIIVALSLLNDQDSIVVAAKIFEKFQGREKVKISEIEHFIWFETPYVWRKEPLKILQKEPEDQPRLTTVADENGIEPFKRYTYRDGTEWRLTFRPQSDEELLQKLQELKL